MKHDSEVYKLSDYSCITYTAGSCCFFACIFIKTCLLNCMAQEGTCSSAKKNYILRPSLIELFFLGFRVLKFFIWWVVKVLNFVLSLVPPLSIYVIGSAKRCMFQKLHF